MAEVSIEKVFLRRLIESAVIAVILIALFVLILWAVKKGFFPKWTWIIGIIVFTVVSSIIIVGLVKIKSDINNEDYITYQGYYEERGGSQRGLKTVVIFDDNGDEIKLFRNGMDITGKYYGQVVYGRRSEVIVEYHGVPAD